MKLTLEGLRHNLSWRGYRLPQYDVLVAREKTKKNPTWLHFGAGNLFRAFPAVLAQRLLTAGLSEVGVICCEGYDEELIDRCYRANDHLSLVVTLYSNGSINKEVLASVMESLKLSEDMERLGEIFAAPTLQMVSMTITEKGYVIKDNALEFTAQVAEDIAIGPEQCNSFMARLAGLCISRIRKNLPPLALVSLDNCQNNGDRLYRAMSDIAKGWKNNNHITEHELSVLMTEYTYPLSMIDKITPHPDERVLNALEADDLEGMKPFVTSKQTHAAAYVNSERPQYLVIENNFPNGHPPFEQLGVIMTNRSIVERCARMKACTCMNPMDTALAVYGCLLGYTLISEEMKDEHIVNLISRLAENEAMPMVRDPGVIDPVSFLKEVLSERYPNPFLPDSPQRIATDTSRKVAIRYGETLYDYYNSLIPMHRASELIYIPLTIAGWLRYLLGVDDNGQSFALSPDAQIELIRSRMGKIALGDQVSEHQLYSVLASRVLFGVNLFEIGVGEKIVTMFNELNAGPGAVRATLKKYCS